MPAFLPWIKYDSYDLFHFFGVKGRPRYWGVFDTVLHVSQTFPVSITYPAAVAMGYMHCPCLYM